MRYGLNVMEWALTWPEARTQLVDGEEEWAMPMLAQLRVPAAQWCTDERLRAVSDELPSCRLMVVPPAEAVASNWRSSKAGVTAVGRRARSWP